MKQRIALISIVFILAISGCENDDDTFIPETNGLSLYWDHEVFGDEGRRLRFEFNTTEGFTNDYDLVFHYSISGNSIIARLVNSIDNGKCSYYPMPIPGGDPNKCSAYGGFYIPDDELTSGVYTFKVITPNFQVTSEITITDEKITLTIPSNDHLTSSINDVYPIPGDILFGSVVYQGSDNGQFADDFFDDLVSLGLTEITLPDHPYRHLDVDGNGQPTESHWEPDDHAVGFLYKMNKDFNSILELSTEHFNQTDLNIYLYTSNGDQGLMNQATGITVVFGK